MHISLYVIWGGSSMGDHTLHPLKGLVEELCHTIETNVKEVWFVGTHSGV
jgi:hypothetical protein